MLEASLKHTKARQIQSSAFFEDGGMKEVEIITSVHQKHPGEEEGQWKREGEENGQCVHTNLYRLEGMLGVRKNC